MCRVGREYMNVLSKSTLPYYNTGALPYPAPALLLHGLRYYRIRYVTIQHHPIRYQNPAPHPGLLPSTASSTSSTDYYCVHNIRSPKPYYTVRILSEI